MYELPPERLGRWLGRWAELHAPVARTVVAPPAVTSHGADGARVRCEPPFPPLDATGEHDGFVPVPLLAHIERERTAGVVLVRLGGVAGRLFEGRVLRGAGCAGGMWEGRMVPGSRVGSRRARGRRRAGGWSATRFAPRRGNQAREA